MWLEHLNKGGWAVGRVGWRFDAGDEGARLTSRDGERLVRIAREALDLYLRSGVVKKPGAEEAHPVHGGVFCTLTSHPSGDLLGCMGSTHPTGSLEESVIAAAIWSARDPRFPPLEIRELDHTTLELSILSPLERVHVTPQEAFPSAIQPGQDGLVIRCSKGSGLLLPQVWAKVPDPQTFLAVLCFKAGLSSKDAWRAPDVRLYRFQVQVFRELTPGGNVKEESGPWLPSGDAPAES